MDIGGGLPRLLPKGGGKRHALYSLSVRDESKPRTASLIRTEK
jgi:ribosomal protein S16